MAHVLIIDADKASVVMTSELIKDHMPGTTVGIAGTGKAALEGLDPKNPPDLIVIDFDLPDCDGATLGRLLRDKVRCPMVITAFSDNVVAEAISEELFLYDDCGTWLAKPLKLETIGEVLDKFLCDHHRLDRRFETECNIGWREARARKAKAGRVVNLSIGGALVQLNAAPTTKVGASVTLTFPRASTLGSLGEVSATVVWVNTRQRSVGVMFNKVTTARRNKLEGALRTLAVGQEE